MKLVEREEFLTSLQIAFNNIVESGGHCIFVSGEAGIGKTSLVNTFCNSLKDTHTIYSGTCDALFTPRPLAPLYDIALQVGNGFQIESSDASDRAGIFAKFLQAMSNQKRTTVIVFEDIHWADEATLDFIKFFARRIARLNCFFILTYRDNEITAQHPLRNVIGQLPAGSFSKIQLSPLSKKAVKKMAAARGYNGEDVYSITGGNPFYVTEILASYSTGVPDSIKDAVLSVYNRVEEKTKEVWELLSVMPAGFEIKYLDKLEPFYTTAIESSLNEKILLANDGQIYFKHELFRRTIETALSPLKRISLNKKVLGLLGEAFEKNGAVERIIHHAKNANEYETVVRYAPLAARDAAMIGAHTEAAKLYLSAIEYYQGTDKDLLLQFYENYAYECYLTNQIKEAIIYSSKCLVLWIEKNDIAKTGTCLRFLSRLWWNDDNLEKANSFATQSIEVLEKLPAGASLAMAYANLAQLKMFADLHDECVELGEQAIALARKLDAQEIISYALNNVGSVKSRVPATQQEGFALLQQSLDIALQYSYHEHVARAYTNQAYNGIIIKENKFAEKALEAGALYCEENNLELWTAYMRIANARLALETGNWNEAFAEAEKILSIPRQTGIIKIFSLVILALIKMRRGDKDGIMELLEEAKQKSFETMEPQRVIRAMAASLEYEWITGSRFIENTAIDTTLTMMEHAGNIYDNSEFIFWLLKARNQRVLLKQTYEGYETGTVAKAKQAAAVWEKVGCKYYEAIASFDGNEEDKRNAVNIVHTLGANAVYEKMKMEMRATGIKNIPRGKRKSTQANTAFLTSREIDILELLKEGLQNKEIAGKLFISAKTVDNHISSILYKLEVNSRIKAVQEALRLEIIK